MKARCSPDGCRSPSHTALDDQRIVRAAWEAANQESRIPKWLCPSRLLVPGASSHIRRLPKISLFLRLQEGQNVIGSVSRYQAAQPFMLAWKRLNNKWKSSTLQQFSVLLCLKWKASFHRCENHSWKCSLRDYFEPNFKFGFQALQSDFIGCQQFHSFWRTLFSISSCELALTLAVVRGRNVSHVFYALISRITDHCGAS